MNVNPLNRIKTSRAVYEIHKTDAHGGKSDVFCELCAEAEYALNPGKMRRDSE